MAITQFWIFEIIQHQSGEFEHYVHFTFDANAQMALVKAQEKMHSLFAGESEKAYLIHNASIKDVHQNTIEKTEVIHPVTDPVAEEPTEEPVGE